MNAFFRTASAILTLLGLAQSVAGQTAGTVLFAQPGTQIVAESGIVRAAVKGDVLQTGERLVTPAGAISQVVLPDGSLIGMRPESELKITPALAGSGSKAPVVGLISGTVRVIGAELMDSKKISNFSLQSGAATVNLKGADLESAVVRPDAKPGVGGGAGALATPPGSYQRLLAGTANVGNGNQVTALAPQQVSFVGGVNSGPVTLSPSALNVFGSNRPTPAQQTVTGTSPGTKTNPPSLVKPVTPPSPLSPMAPPVAGIKIPVPPVPAVRPCTRFIGKTCVQ